MTMPFLEASQQIYSYRFALALKASKCPYLMFRLKGIDQFNDLAIRGKQQKQKSNTKEDPHWLNPVTFWQLVEDHNVVEEYLGSRMQPEILKRIDSFFEFLVTEGYWTREIMEKLWNASEQAHESITSLVYDKIVDIVVIGLGERNVTILYWLEDLIRNRYFHKDESSETVLKNRYGIEKQDHKPEQLFLTFLHKLNDVICERPFVCADVLPLWSKLLMDIYMVGTCGERQTSSFMTDDFKSVGTELEKKRLTLRESSKVRDALRCPPEKFGMCETCFSYWALLKNYFRVLNEKRHKATSYSESTHDVFEVCNNNSLEAVSFELGKSDRFIKAIYMLLCLLDIAEMRHGNRAAESSLSQLDIVPKIVNDLESTAETTDNRSPINEIDYTLRLHALLKMHITVRDDDAEMEYSGHPASSNNCLLSFENLLRMHESVRKFARLQDILFLFFGHLFEYQGPYLLNGAGAPLNRVSGIKITSSQRLKLRLWRELLAVVPSELVSPSQFWAFSVGFLWANSITHENQEDRANNDVDDSGPITCKIGSFADMWNEALNVEGGDHTRDAAMSIHVEVDEKQGKYRSKMHLRRFSNFSRTDFGRLLRIFCLCPYDTFPEALELLSTLSSLRVANNQRNLASINSAVRFMEVFLSGLGSFMGHWYQLDDPGHALLKERMSRLAKYPMRLPRLDGMECADADLLMQKAVSRLLQVIHRILVYFGSLPVGVKDPVLEPKFVHSVDSTYVPIRCALIPPRINETFVEGVPVCCKFYLPANSSCNKICEKVVNAMAEAGFRYSTAECKIFVPHQVDLSSLLSELDADESTVTHHLRDRLTTWLTSSVYHRLKLVNRSNFISHTLDVLHPVCIVQIPPSTVSEDESILGAADYSFQRTLPYALANSSFALDILFTACEIGSLTEEDLLVVSGSQSVGISLLCREYLPCGKRRQYSSESVGPFVWNAMHEKHFQTSETKFPRVDARLLPDRSQIGSHASHQEELKERLTEYLDLGNHRLSSVKKSFAQHFALTTPLIFADATQSSVLGTQCMHCIALQSWDILTTQLPLSGIALNALRDPKGVPWKSLLSTAKGYKSKEHSSSLQRHGLSAWDDRISSLYLLGGVVAILQSSDLLESHGQLVDLSWKDEFVGAGGLNAFVDNFIDGYEEPNVPSSVVTALCCSVFRAASTMVTWKKGMSMDVEEIDCNSTSVLCRGGCETQALKYLVPSMQRLHNPPSFSAGISFSSLNELHSKAIGGYWLNVRLVACHFCYLFSSVAHLCFRYWSNSDSTNFGLDETLLRGIVCQLGKDGSAQMESIPSTGVDMESLLELLGRELMLSRSVGDNICLNMKIAPDCSAAVINEAVCSLGSICDHLEKGSTRVAELNNNRKPASELAKNPRLEDRLPLFSHSLLRVVAAGLRTESGWTGSDYRCCSDVLNHAFRLLNIVAKTSSMLSGSSSSTFEQSLSLTSDETPGRTLARFPVLDIGYDAEALASECMLVIGEVMKMFSSCGKVHSGPKVEVLSELFTNRNLHYLIIFLLRNILGFCGRTIVESNEFRELVNDCVYCTIWGGFFLLANHSNVNVCAAVQEVIDDIIDHCTCVVSQLSWTNSSGFLSRSYRGNDSMKHMASQSDSEFQNLHVEPGPCKLVDNTNCEIRSMNPVRATISGEMKEYISWAEQAQLALYVNSRGYECQSNPFMTISTLSEMIECPKAERSRIHNASKASRYVGLVNQGMTCYMNSLLQQLFMIPSLRRALLAAKEPAIDHQFSERLMELRHQVQMLIGILACSDVRVYNPLSLIETLRDEPRGFFPLDSHVMEQNDANEFYQLFMDRLGEVFPASCAKLGDNTISENAGAEEGKDAEPDILQQTLGGTLAHQIIGQHVDYVSERSEPFMCIQLDVASKTNIYESLDSFVSSEILSGDNAYELPSGERVSVLKRCCFRRLPNTLVFHLKRFDLDFDTFEKVKINSRFEFEDRLNIWEYTARSLANATEGKQFNNSEEQSVPLPGEEPQSPDDCEYVLRGVLVHSGTAEYGHYFSYVHEREVDVLSRCREDPFEVARSIDSSDAGTVREDCGKWICFNDDNVYEIEDAHFVKHRWFGGQKDKRGYEDSTTSAFMLFYDRVGSSDPYEKMNARDQVASPAEILNSLVNSPTEHYKEKIRPHPYFLPLTNNTTAGLPMPRELVSFMLLRNSSFWVQRRLGEGLFQRLICNVAKALIRHKMNREPSGSQEEICNIPPFKSSTGTSLERCVMAMINFLSSLDMRCTIADSCFKRLSESPDQQAIERPTNASEETASLLGAIISLTEEKDMKGKVFRLFSQCSNGYFDLDSCLGALCFISEYRSVFLRQNLSLTANESCKRFAMEITARIMRSLNKITREMSEVLKEKGISHDDVLNAAFELYPESIVPPTAIVEERKIWNTPVNVESELEYALSFRPWCVAGYHNKYLESNVAESSESFEKLVAAVQHDCPGRNASEMVKQYLRVVESLSRFFKNLASCMPSVLSVNEATSDYILYWLQSLVADFSSFNHYLASQQGLLETMIALCVTPSCEPNLATAISMSSVEEMRKEMPKKFPGTCFYDIVASMLTSDSNENQETTQDLWSVVRQEMSDRWSMTAERYFDEVMSTEANQSLIPDCFNRLSSVFLQEGCHPVISRRLFEAIQMMTLGLLSDERNCNDLPSPTVCASDVTAREGVALEFVTQPPLSVPETVFDCVTGSQFDRLETFAEAKVLAQEVATEQGLNCSDSGDIEVLVKHCLPNNLCTLFRSIDWFDGVILSPGGYARSSEFFEHLSFSNPLQSRRICAYLMWSIIRKRFPLIVRRAVIFPTIVNLIKLCDGLKPLRISWILGALQSDVSGDKFLAHFSWPYVRMYWDGKGVTQRSKQHGEKNNVSVPRFKAEQDRLHRMTISSEKTEQQHVNQFCRYYGLFHHLTVKVLGEEHVLELLKSERIETEEQWQKLLSDQFDSQVTEGKFMPRDNAADVAEMMYLLSGIYTKDTHLPELAPLLKEWLVVLTTLVGDTMSKHVSDVHEHKKFVKTQQESDELKAKLSMAQVALKMLNHVQDPGNHGIVDEASRGSGDHNEKRNDFLCQLTIEFLRSHGVLDDVPNIADWIYSTTRYCVDSPSEDKKKAANRLSEEVLKIGKAQGYRSDWLEPSLARLYNLFLGIVNRYDLCEKQFLCGKRERTACEKVDDNPVATDGKDSSDGSEGEESSKRRRK